MGRGHGSTALSVAIRYGHLALVKFLLANSSDINLKTGFPSLCTTPLYSALTKCKEEIVKALFAHGADVDEKHLRQAISKHNKQALEMFLAKYGPDRCHSNLLEFAAEVGDTEIFQFLLDKGFDHETAFVKAMEYNHEAIVTLLLAQGSDPDLPSLRESVLGKAITYRRIRIMEILLRHGVKIYPEVLKSAEVFAPKDVTALAKQFPMHSIRKMVMYPSAYIIPEHEHRISDAHLRSTRRRLSWKGKQPNTVGRELRHPV